MSLNVCRPSELDLSRLTHRAHQVLLVLSDMLKGTAMRDDARRRWGKDHEPRLRAAVGDCWRELLDLGVAESQNFVDLSPIDVRLHAALDRLLAAVTRLTTFLFLQDNPVRDWVSAIPEDAMLHAIDSVRELIEVKELSSEGGRTKPKSSTEKETGDDPLAEFAAAIEKAELSGTERRVANLVLSKGGRVPIVDARAALEQADVVSAYKRANNKLKKHRWRLCQRELSIIAQSLPSP